MDTAILCEKCGAKLTNEAALQNCPKCLMGLALNPASNSSDENQSSHPRRKKLLRADQLVGRFPNLEIMHLIGHGGMGTVYQARQTNLDRIVALKVLAPELGEDPTFAERFTREARTLAKLSHKNIVTVFDFGVADDMHFLVMELIEGINLRDAILAQQFTPSHALGIIQQICEALQYAHDNGVIHRDIKPENILLDKKGNVKIADFGLAKLLQPHEDDFTLTATRQVLGTYNYMAPEQIERPEAVDHRSDLYSLGVVFYELLTGELPIGRFALPSEKAKVSGQLDDVVMKTLEKEPERRFQQASEFRTAVKELDADDFPSRLGKPTQQMTTANRNSNASVTAILPFSGLLLENYAPVYVTGIARLVKDVVEFQFQRFNSGAMESSSLSLDDVKSISLKRGIFKNSIEIQTNGLDAVTTCPGQSQGRIKLRIKKSDLPLAREFQRGVANQIPEPPMMEVAAAPPVKPGTGSQDWSTTRIDHVTVDERLKVPRFGMLLMSILYAIGAMLWLGATIPPVFSQFLDEGQSVLWKNYDAPGGGPPFGIACLVFLGLVAISFVSFCCWLNLRRVRNFHFLVAASFVGVALVPLNLITIPFFLWILVVMCFPQTRRVFRANALSAAIEEVEFNNEHSRESNKQSMLSPTMLLSIVAVAIVAGIVGSRVPFSNPNTGQPDATPADVVQTNSIDLTPSKKN